MNPKIDVTITDSHGDYATLVSDNFEPYEVYVNNERFCTSERLDELGSENNELRERIEYLEDELRKQGSAAGKFMAMAREYQEDNKKLREFAKSYLAAAGVDCGICPYCDPELCDTETDPMREGCRLWEEMRKLGVEVSE